MKPIRLILILVLASCDLFPEKKMIEIVADEDVDLLYMIDADDQAKRVYIYDSSDLRSNGLVWIWVPENDDRQVILSDLSRFEFASREILSNVKRNFGDSKKVDALRQLVCKYLTISHCIVINKERLPVLIKGLRDKYEDEELMGILPKIRGTKEEISDEAWVFSYYVVTFQGSLELRVVSGTFNPYTVQSYENRIIAPVGFVPELDWTTDQKADEADMGGRGSDCQR